MAVYVPNYGGNWQTGAGGGTPITEAALDNLETQFTCAVAEIDPATKQFDISVAYDTAGGAAANIAGDSFGMLVTALQTVCFHEFRIPHDFTALTSCVIRVRKSTNGNIDWTVDTDFGADNEAYTTHSDSDTANGVVMVDTRRYEVDCSAAFTGLLAGDMVGMKFTLDAITAGNLIVLGATFTYS